MKKGLGLCFLVVLVFGCVHRPSGLEGYNPVSGLILKEVDEEIYLRHVPLYIGGLPKQVDPETFKNDMYIFHDQNFWGVPNSPPSPLDKLEMVKEEDGTVWWKIKKSTLLSQIKPSKRPSLNENDPEKLVEGRFFTYGVWKKTNGERYIYWAEYTFSNDPHIFYNPDGSACLFLNE